jgi:penicillin-binding protein 2
MWNRTDDPNLLPEFYRQFGFGEKTGVDLPGEGAGRVPTREWQEETGETTDDKLWTVGRWVNMAIGQGDLLVTPIQLLRGYAAIANGGTLITPHVGMDAQDQNGRLVEKIDPKPAGEMGVDPYYIQETIRGLKMVTAPGGTAENAFNGSPLSVAGKTGTGEMWGKDPINYFVGWAENQGDPLVVLVMVEEGGAFEHGSEVTVAPAARNILEAYHGANRSSNEDSAD